MREYEVYCGAVERIPHFLEDVHNRKRIHSLLGYMLTEELEYKFIKKINLKSTPT